MRVEGNRSVIENENLGTIWYNLTTPFLNDGSSLFPRICLNCLDLLSNSNQMSSNKVMDTNAKVAPTAGGTETCSICNKKAYPLESLKADEKTYHKTCMRCQHPVCGKMLQLGNYAAMK